MRNVSLAFVFLMNISLVFGKGPCDKAPEPKCKREISDPCAPCIQTMSWQECQPGFPGFVFGEFLYWKPYMPVPLAVSSQIVSFPANLALVSLRDADHVMKFDVEPGWRVGAGYIVPHAQWNLLFYWTQLNSDHRDTVLSLPGKFVSPFWTQFALANPTQVTMKSKLHYNVADLELAKFFFPACSFSLRPSFGVRGAWLNVHSTMHLPGLTQSTTNRSFNDFVKLKNEFEGVGLRTALASYWELGRGLSLFASGGFGLLYGETEVKFKEQLTGILSGNFVTGTVNSPNKYFGIKSVFDTLIGFQWERRFCNACEIHFHIAYELTNWINQFQLRQDHVLFLSGLVGANDYMPFKSYADLTFQGLDIGAKINF